MFCLGLDSLAAEPPRGSTESVLPEDTFHGDREQWGKKEGSHK